MSVADRGGAAAPEPVHDPASYTQVTVVRTEEVDGHVYRRGQKPNVDAATLAAMRAKSMLLEDAPASAEKTAG